MDNSPLDTVLSEATPEAAPVETQAVETAPEATGEPTAPPADKPEDPIEKHTKGLEAATLAERTRRQNAEARAQAAEERLQQFMQQQSKPAEEGPPDPAAFQDNPQEYWAKLARYEARQELKLERERQAEDQRQQQQQAQAQRLTQATQSTVEAGRAEFSDFDSVINSGLAPFMTPLLQQALVMTNGGHKLAHHLGRNPAEAARIAQLEPMQMLIELGELRVKATAPVRQAIPQTLTDARDARGRFVPAQDGPTPLSAVLGRPS